MKRIFLLFTILFMAGGFCRAEVTLNHIFDNNMVLQRDKQVRIWGWASPGENVSVSFGKQFVQTKADNGGDWEVFLKPMEANGNPQTLKVTGANNQVVCSNILVGDIWVFGGQSNMEFDLNRTFGGDIEIKSAKNRNIRIITIPRVFSGKKKLKDFDRIIEMDDWLHQYEDKGSWLECSPDKIGQFTTIGYMFGKTLQDVVDVPIGLIDASLGGTALEAWISPERMASMPENAGMLKYWNTQLKNYNPVKDLKNKVENWKRNSESRKKQGLAPLPKPTEPSPSPVENRSFPSACYNGYISPIKGFAVRGAVFHHGFNNALSDSRPKLYEANFKALVEDWRKAFNDNSLPFGIVEFCASGTPQTLENYEACLLDAAPFIREGQYAAYRDIKNVGYCCAYDLQVNWFHPQKKLPLGVRMARWALSEVYGMKEFVWCPAKVVNVEFSGSSAIVTFDKEVKSSDDRPMDGFALAGEDKHFYPTTAVYFVKNKGQKGKVEYDKKKLVITNPLVEAPVALRYAWARNPIANLVSDRIIPVPQFRTDEWPHPEAPYVTDDPEGYADHMKLIRELPKQAEALSMERRIKEAEYFLKVHKQ